MKKPYFKWLVLLLCLSGLESRAQALDPTHVYKLVCRSTGQSLEIGGSGNLNDDGRGANTWSYWGHAHQQWTFLPYPLNSSTPQGYIIGNRNSKLTLYGDNPNAGSGFNQHPTGYSPSNSSSRPGNNEFWIIQQAGNYPGAPYLLHLPDNYYLTADGNNNVFKQRYDANNNTMLWDIIDVSKNASLDYTQGTFQLINLFSKYYNTSYALSVSPTEQTNRGVGPLVATGYTYQEWTVVPSTTTNDYYYIVSRWNGSALVLEIGGGDTNNGARVNLWDNYQHPWQEWAFLDVNDSHVLKPSEFTDGRSFKLYSRHAGKVLELHDDGTNGPGYADIWNDYGNANQRWRLKFRAYNRVEGTALATSQASASENLGITIYPNPAQEELTVASSSVFNLATSTINVVDACGKQVGVDYQKGKADISKLPAGLYVITISDGKQTVHQKFTKL